MIQIASPRLRQLVAVVAVLLLGNVVIFLYNHSGANRGFNPAAFRPSNTREGDGDGVGGASKFQGKPGPPAPSTPPSTDFLNLADQGLQLGPYYPYSRQTRGKRPTGGKGSIRACRGPRGTRSDDYSPNLIKAYSVSPQAPNPIPMFGSYGEVGMDDAHCFDRKGRLEPYGYTEDHSVLENSTEWDSVDWGVLQEQCIEENKEVYDQDRDQASVSHLRLPDPKSSTEGATRPNQKWAGEANTGSGQTPRPRTAVLLRGWDTLQYTAELRQHIRSTISELSLFTGGEYAVYLVIEIKDPERKIFESQAAYADALNNCVPFEFRNLTILFNQKLLEAWYPEAVRETGGLTGQALHMNQPVQLFSIFNPQFEFVWDVELDVRFTGNWYNLLSSMASWSKASPRKLQWERAQKFYMPSYHGSYENFTTSISVQNPSGGVWGPVSNPGFRAPIGPIPPELSPNDDHFQWGVGEEADDITPSAVIETTNTKTFEIFTVAGFDPKTERHALMVTPVKRLSRRLLRAMHQAQLEGLDMRSELFAHTVALAHGMKVAFAPIPMYFNDMTKNSAEVNEIFNAAEGRGRIWTDGANELNLLAMSNTTYWWRLEFEQYPRMLYRKWYGLDQEGNPLKEEKGRLCLPGIMIHPVKDVVKGVK